MENYLKMTQLDKVYLAGVIDGRGSISIIQNKPKVTNKQINYSYNTVIEISSRSIELMEWLCERVGGNYYAFSTCERGSKYIKRKRYRWTINGKNVGVICEYIKPFLITKKRECEVMILMRSTFRNEIGCSTPVDQEAQNFRVLCWEEMLALNTIKLEREE
jgi:hypothetical protein